MTFSPSSFRTRLILGAALWISLGFAISWVVLTNLLRAHVLTEFASELDHHAIELAELAQLDAEGGLVIRAPLSDFRFSTTGSGHYWQISQIGGGTLASDSLGDARLPLELTPTGGPDLREAQIDGPSGPAMMLERLIRVGTETGPVARVAVAMDLSLIRGYMGALERTLALAMACLAAGLVLAAMAQITYALRPLARIDVALRGIKRGDKRRMPTDLPAEVRPLVENLNALLEKNESMIQRARLQAGNLAHALKTSLAHLQIEAGSLSENDRRSTVIQQHCNNIRRQIDYQLARARATASRTGGLHSTRVKPVIEAVVSAVQRLYRDCAITIEADAGTDEALVACGTEDLEEVLGNLIDNAAKWARRRAVVSATAAQGGNLLIRIDDDGPGMPTDMHERVFRPGERLDESTPGSGLGLAIARDIVSLYEGRMWIEPSCLGGACVCVELQRVV